MSATLKPSVADQLYQVARELPQAVQRRLLATAKQEAKARAPKTAKQQAKELVLARIKEGMIEAKEIAAGRKKALSWDEFNKELDS